jgi:hypothetical protein
MFRKQALLPSSGTEASKLVDPLDSNILSLGTTETLNLLRYAPEKKSSPRVVNTPPPLKLQVY